MISLSGSFLSKQISQHSHLLTSVINLAIFSLLICASVSVEEMVSVAEPFFLFLVFFLNEEKKKQKQTKTPFA